jgi:hypothetical protein
MVYFIYFAQIIQAPTKSKGEPMIPFVAMGWFHLVFMLVLLNIHEIWLKLKSRFRNIHKSPTRGTSTFQHFSVGRIFCHTSPTNVLETQNISKFP